MILRIAWADVAFLSIFFIMHLKNIIRDIEVSKMYMFESRLLTSTCPWCYIMALTWLTIQHEIFVLVPASWAFNSGSLKD